VRAGDADVAVLAGGRALFAAQDADDAVVSAVQAGSQAARGGRLPPPLPVVTEGGASSSDRQGIAFVAGVILYGQLLGYGFWVATGVVEEKSTRVVELLLSAIRPRQLLAGKVIGIGLLGLGQLILIGLCGVLIGSASGQLDVNGDVAAAVGVVMLWFLLGFALYSCAFAVAGALVPRQARGGTADRLTRHVARRMARGGRAGAGRAPGVAALRGPRRGRRPRRPGRPRRRGSSTGSGPRTRSPAPARAA
jgi:ABC-2 type transport system permease protein